MISLLAFWKVKGTHAQKIAMQMLISAKYVHIYKSHLHFTIISKLPHRVQNHFSCSIKWEKSIKLLSPAECPDEREQELSHYIRKKEYVLKEAFLRSRPWPSLLQVTRSPSFPQTNEWARILLLICMLVSCMVEKRVQVRSGWWAKLSFLSEIRQEAVSL